VKGLVIFNIVSFLLSVFVLMAVNVIIGANFLLKEVLILSLFINISVDMLIFFKWCLENHKENG
jgi:hypothetical protein